MELISMPLPAESQELPFSMPLDATLAVSAETSCRKDEDSAGDLVLAELTLERLLA
jgi:hypothetical protein